MRKETYHRYPWQLEPPARLGPRLIPTDVSGDPVHATVRLIFTKIRNLIMETNGSEFIFKLNLEFCFPRDNLGSELALFVAPLLTNFFTLLDDFFRCG